MAFARSISAAQFRMAARAFDSIKSASVAFLRTQGDVENRIEVSEQEKEILEEEL